MDPDLLHDDGEQITVYVNRKHMRQHARQMLFFMALCALASGNAFYLPQDPLEPTNWQASILFFGAIACICALAATVYFVRSLKRSPILTVNADGITVHRQFLTGDKKLLPWYEIAWVGNEMRMGPSFFAQTLIINQFQFPDASARRPLEQTPSPKAPYPFTTTVLRIREESLDIPVGELIYEIERYIKVHAPAGWHGELSDEQRDHVLVIEPTDSTVA